MGIGHTKKLIKFGLATQKFMQNQDPDGLKAPSWYQFHQLTI